MNRYKTECKTMHLMLIIIATGMTAPSLHSQMNEESPAITNASEEITSQSTTNVGSDQTDSSESAPQENVEQPLIADREQSAESGTTSLTDNEQPTNASEEIKSSDESTVQIEVADTEAAVTSDPNVATVVEVDTTQEVSAPEDSEGAIQANQPTEETVVSVESKVVEPENEKPKVPEVDEIAQSEALFQAVMEEGVDDTQDDSGNWYLKRNAWKKARPKYDQMRQIASRVEKSIKAFLDKRKTIEQTNDSFYLDVGIEQGEGIQLINDILNSLQKEKQSLLASLSEEERQDLIALNEKKQKDVEELKLYFEGIKKTDENLIDAIFNSLIEQQQLVQSYEEKSLENYYKISEILDDKKARELLNEMDNYIENAESIDNWISGPLTQYVDQSINRINEYMQKTRLMLSNLKAQGIELKSLIAQKEAEQKTIEERLAAEKAAKAKAEAERQKNTGFFMRIWDMIQKFFSWLWPIVIAPFSYVYNLFVSPVSSTQKELIRRGADIPVQKA